MDKTTFRFIVAAMCAAAAAGSLGCAHEPKTAGGWGDVLCMERSVSGIPLPAPNGGPDEVARARFVDYYQTVYEAKQLKGLIACIRKAGAGDAPRKAAAAEERLAKAQARRAALEADVPEPRRIKVVLSQPDGAVKIVHRDGTETLVRN